MSKEKDTSIASPEFILSRTFEAPRELVWRAWTEAARFAEWWGPKGFDMLTCSIDLRPGGLCHYGMRAPNGAEMWGKFVYREIVKPERLVFVVSFSDKNKGTQRHFASPTWPLKVLNTTAFAGHGGNTTVTVRGVPIDATAEECRTFEQGFASMKEGFAGTWDQLAEYLAKA